MLNTFSKNLKNKCLNIALPQLGKHLMYSHLWAPIKMMQIKLYQRPIYVVVFFHPVTRVLTLSFL